MNNLVEKKMQSLSNIFRAPSTQKSEKNYRSSFSQYASNGSIMRNESSGCNIPRPLRYSFRNSESKSNIIDSVRHDTSPCLYTNTKSDQNILTSVPTEYTPQTDLDELKEELQKRNITILNLQSEIKELKSKHQAEIEKLLSKSTSSEYQEFQKQLDDVLKENSDLSKRLQQLELESKQLTISKNQKIKSLEKKLTEVQEQTNKDKDDKREQKIKAGREADKEREKVAMQEANLKNRIRILEMENEEMERRVKERVEYKVNRIKVKMKKMKEEMKGMSKKIRELEEDVKEKDTKLAAMSNKINELITNEHIQKQKSSLPQTPSISS